MGKLVRPGSILSALRQGCGLYSLAAEPGELLRLRQLTPRVA
jgi:hypothetical protein